MALKFDLSTVDLKIDKTGVVHAASLVPKANPTVAIIHLTKGAKLTAPGLPFDKAYTLTGSVEVLLDQESDLDGWSFTFLQFADLMVRSSTYGGRTAGEGSVHENFAVGPAFPTNPSLDATPSESPYMGLSKSSNTRVADGPPIRIKIERETGDHPHSQQSIVNGNVTTNVSNLLWNMRLDLGLFPCFVAVDPKGNRTYLAHLEIHAVWDAKFQWQGSQCTGGVVHNPRLDTGQAIKGKPTNSKLQTLVANPKGPLYNDLCKAANATVLSYKVSTPPCHEEKAIRDPNIPSNFVT